MDIIISNNSSMPIYEQITSQVKAQVMDGRLQQLSVPDDQNGIAGQQAAESDMVLANPRKDDFGRHKGQNGDDAVKQGDVHILQRHRGDGRHQNGDHQLSRLQLSF